MTHKQLVTRMALWLQHTKRHHIVVTELKTQNRECPDVISFYGSGASMLIECKVSRADFLADKAKSFRRWEESGMGDHRYFAIPHGLVSPEEMPDGWGMLSVRDNQVREEAEAKLKKADKRAEVRVLMSAIRRLEISTAVFVRQETP